MKDIFQNTLTNIKDVFANLKKSRLFYLCLVGAGLMLPALFFEWAVYILAAFIAISIFFLKFDEGLGFIVFFYPAEAVFETSYINIYFALFGLFVVYYGVRHIIKLIKTKEKPNLSIVVSVIIYLIILVLPIRTGLDGSKSHFASFEYIASVAIVMALVYIVLKNREGFNFLIPIRLFICGLLMSCIYGLFYNVSDRLQCVITYSDYFDSVARFSGLFTGSNMLAIMSAFAFFITLYLYFSKKIQREAYLYTLISFVAGYSTMARSFLYTAIICFVLYAIFVVIRDKKQSYKEILPFLAIFIIIALIMFDTTKNHIRRLTLDDLTNGYSNSTDKTIEEMEQMHDPGRGGLFKWYFKDFMSSITTILLGRGIAHPWKWGLSSHNTYLQSLWCTGIVGTLILCVIILLFIKAFTNLKLIDIIKLIFTNPAIYVLFIPILALLFIENLFFKMQCTVAVLLITSALLVISKNKEKTEEKSQKK